MRFGCHGHPPAVIEFESSLLACEMRVLLAPDVNLAAMRTLDLTIVEYLFSKQLPIHKHACLDRLACRRTVD